MKKRYFVLFLSVISIGVYFFNSSDSSKNKTSGFDKFIVKNNSDSTKPQEAKSITTNGKAEVNNTKRELSSVRSQPSLDLGEELPKVQNKSAIFTFSDEELTYDEGVDTALVEGVYALKKEGLDLSGFEVIEDRGFYVLVKSEVALGQDALEIVKVKGSNKLGIFTGIIKVKLQDFDLYDTMIDQHSYEVDQLYPNINRAFYKFYSYQEAIDAYNYLKSHSNVEDIDLEILQYQRTSR